jgi:tRNA G18 (ribose-2'-O)-methylase SpoU
VAEFVSVDDPDDERLADYVRLTDADHKRRGEIFLCEGVLVIERALEAGTELQSALVTPNKLAVLRPQLERLDMEVFVVDQDVMNHVTGFAIHRGAIAAATRPRQPALDELLVGPTIAVLEGINDHENLGALFRNAAAFGIGGVVLDPTTADPLYRRAVRVSLGHVLAVRHHRVERWPEALNDVRAAGYEVVALTPSDDAQDIDELPLDGKVAFLLGAEGPGLAPEALAAADRRVRIPIASGVDSLNVATAAAIAFHHRFRAG